MDPTTSSSNVASSRQLPCSHPGPHSRLSDPINVPSDDNPLNTAGGLLSSPRHMRPLPLSTGSCFPPNCRRATHPMRPVHRSSSSILLGITQERTNYGGNYLDNGPAKPSLVIGARRSKALSSANALELLSPVTKVIWLVHCRDFTPMG